jgi:hypothetical protein
MCAIIRRDNSRVDSMSVSAVSGATIQEGAGADGLDGERSRVEDPTRVAVVVAVSRECAVVDSHRAIIQDATAADLSRAIVCDRGVL